MFWRSEIDAKCLEQRDLIDGLITLGVDQLPAGIKRGLLRIEHGKIVIHTDAETFLR